MSDYDGSIWSRLNTYIRNDFGTAGLMGNLQAESGLIPYRLQGDFISGYTTSIQYTNDVDKGVKSRESFISDSKGYGLAQWTTRSRKSKYYDYEPLNNSSIGSLYRGCDFLIHELQTDFPSVWNTLKNATSVKQASDPVLHIYENPREQGPDVENYRESLGIAIYNRFSHDQPIPPPPTPPTPTPSGAYIPLWLLGKIARDKQN